MCRFFLHFANNIVSRVCYTIPTVDDTPPRITLLRVWTLIYFLFGVFFICLNWNGLSDCHDKSMRILIPIIVANCCVLCLIEYRMIAGKSQRVCCFSICPWLEFTPKDLGFLNLLFFISNLAFNFMLLNNTINKGQCLMNETAGVYGFALFTTIGLFSFTGVIIIALGVLLYKNCTGNGKYNSVSTPTDAV